MPCLLKTLTPEKPQQAQIRVEGPRILTIKFGMVILRSRDLERSWSIFLRFSCSAIQENVYGKRMKGGRQRESVCFGSEGPVDGRVRMGQDGIEEASIGQGGIKEASIGFLGCG
jgi:hypothetical protein